MEKKKLTSSLFAWSFLFVYLIKDAESSLKILFYALFLFSMSALFLYFKTRGLWELASFYAGVVAGFAGLYFFQAYPFVEGWTRRGSFLEEALKLPFPMHHSLIAILLSPFGILLYIKRELLPPKLRFLIFLIFGFTLFAIISQIPYMILHRTFFWE